MSLYAYNMTTSPLSVASSGILIVTIPVVSAGGSARSAQWDVTNEFRGLSGPQQTAVQALVAAGSLQLQWSQSPEYSLGVIVVAANTPPVVGAVLASGVTVTLTATIHHISGVAAIDTIVPPFPGFRGAVNLIPDGAFSGTLAGNIGVAFTAVVGRQIDVVYDGTKWWPSTLA
jgi:hypothetical protein